MITIAILTRYILLYIRKRQAIAAKIAPDKYTLQYVK